MPILRLFISGRPRTKGSMKVITPRGRKPIMVEDHAHSKPWRERVAKEIRTFYPNLAPTEQPVKVQATFWFQRSGPSALVLPWPTLTAGVNANGDLDKLLRNVLDALQDAKVIADDAQVCQIVSTKRWCDLGGGPNGLDIVVSLLPNSGRPE